MHADQYFHLWDKLRQTNERGGVRNGAYNAAMWIARSLFQSLIIQLDNIRAGQGVTIQGLIEEAKRDGLIIEAQVSSLMAKIDKWSDQLRNIGRQRNELVAHRTHRTHFARVKEEFPVTRDDLCGVTAMYYEVAVELYMLIPWGTHAPWQLENHQDDGEALMSLLTAQNTTPT